MTKRGSLVYKGLITIILSAFLVVSFITIGNQYGDAEAPHKQAIANDLALLINQLQAMPGDVVFFYGQDVSMYGVEIQGTTILVYTSSLGRDEISAARSRFIGKDIPQTKAEKAARLVITKQGDLITLSSI